ncbi:MAG: cation diffusion facilitator family transporter [Culturomica sp.]|jgi:cobalt-zinc-cadmium efflux system protein|nr:cation diffusion facilitator family transporter [Culturomica sp.]
MAHSETARHTHHHSPDLNHLNRAFIWGIALNLGFVCVEFGSGLWLDSLALISDAGHNFSDVISLVLAMLAFKLVKVKPSARYTYGYKKSTVLVSLLNACILLVAVGIILTESIQKLSHPPVVEGGAIAWIAGAGIVINAFTAWLFRKDREKDLNVKGAYLHMAADTLVSAGVLVSGVLMQYTGWYLLDPIIGMVIAVVILLSTAGLLHDSLRLSLDGVPAGIYPEKIGRLLQEADPRIRDVHHIHIWAISTTENALTAHVVIPDPEALEEIKCTLKKLLKARHIQHTTLEFELPDGECGMQCS